MAWLAQVALSNAVMALPLAGVVWLISRCSYSRRPALVHTLWVLVLVKLLTPPLLTIPLPVLVADPAAAVSQVATAPANGRDRSTSDFEVWAVSGDAAVHTVQNSGSPKVWLPERSEQPPFTVLVPDRAAASSFPLAAPILSPAKANRMIDLFHAFAWVWIVGAFVQFGREVLRFFRFRQFVASMQEDEDASADCASVARQLGLVTFPKLVHFDGVCTPMLWGIGPSMRIIFPRRLWNELNPAARKTLLAHELAHYARGDHWVRLLEVVARSAYWWHPVVNWARREIEASEEECCDSWVVEAVSTKPRTYAEALLATLDFIADSNLVVLPASSGVRKVPFLEYRLQQIMRRAGGRSHSRAGRAVIAVVCVMLLPVHPFFEFIPLSAKASLPAAIQEVLPTKPLITSAGSMSRNGTQPTNQQQLTPNGLPGSFPVHPFVLSADGRYRLQVRSDGRAFVEDRSTRTRHPLASTSITAAASLPSNGRFLTGSADGSINVWNDATGEQTQLSGQSGAEITGIAVNSLGQTAASTTVAGELTIWNLSTGSPQFSWFSSGPIVTVRFSPSGLRIAVATTDQQGRHESHVVLLDVASLEPIASLALPISAVAIEFTNESELLAANVRGDVVRGDFLTGEIQQSPAISPGTVALALFSQNSSLREK